MKSPVYAIDFETYYDKSCNIKELGLRKYVETTDIYLVSIYGPGIQWVGHPKKAPWDRIFTAPWVSHNAGFDRACMRTLSDKLSLPFVWNKVWHCTSSMSAYLRAGRSLKDACKNLLGMEVSKDVRKQMKGLTPDKMRITGSTDPNYECFYSEVCNYAALDAQLCWELWEAHGDKFPEFERWLANHTYEIGWKGLPVDLELAETYRIKLNQIIFDAKKLLPWCDGGEDDVALSPKALKAECMKNGIEPPVSMAQDSEECEEWLEKYAEQYPWVLAMRQVRRANMLLKKTEAVLERTTGTRFNFGLRYYGGHTGRWSGEAGFNVQNMNKEAFEGVDLRHLIRAEEGMKLVIADFAQIEARVLPWLCDDHETLDYVRKGISIYEAHARLTMGYKGDSPMKAHDKKGYALAKARVLALGFGCGPEKFQVMAKTPAYGNLDLEFAECEAIVKDYRAKNPKIVGLWKTLERGLKVSEKKDFDVVLPSGRKLTYFDVKVRAGRQGSLFGSEWCAAKELGSSYQENYYGGKLVENLIQATARDFFAHSLRNVVEAGHEVIFHCHDELIAHVPSSLPKEEIEHLMTSNLPEWGRDFPLGVESVESLIYLK